MSGDERLLGMKDEVENVPEMMELLRKLQEMGLKFEENKVYESNTRGAYTTVKTHTVN